MLESLFEIYQPFQYLIVYTQIKKNEESTGTDYLFLGMKSSNLESTIKKLDTMNSFGETFVPRV